MPQVRAGSYIKWFGEIEINDVPLDGRTRRGR